MKTAMLFNLVFRPEPVGDYRRVIATTLSERTTLKVKHTQNDFAETTFFLLSFLFTMSAVLTNPIYVSDKRLLR